MKPLQFLDSLPLFHHVVRWLRLRKLAAWLLGRFPRQRTLPGSGARYRVRYLETMLLSEEIFTRNVYVKAIDPAKVTHFVDLGSNVGLFAVLLTHLTKRHDLRGLMVDANPAMVEETKWNLAANRLTQVYPLFGLVGSESGKDKAEFYLLPSNLGSSQFPVYEPGKPPKGKWTKVDVGCINLETTWKKLFGEARCHVIKIDIEGSEKTLFQTDREFFRRVDTIILEWHKWIVKREDLDATLKEQGFRLVEILEDIETSGIAWYARPA
jgi:FkbM family methyltransferase